MSQEPSETTDEAAFLSLCSRFQINFSKESHAPPIRGGGIDGIVVTYEIKEGGGPRQVGYTGFFSSWYFDGSGAFIGVGAWE